MTGVSKCVRRVTDTTFALMCIGGLELHSEHGIQQQHAACGPLREIAVIGHREGRAERTVTRELFEYVLQTGWCSNPVLYRKR